MICNTHTHTQTHTHTHTRAHTHIYIHIYIHTYIHNHPYKRFFISLYGVTLFILWRVLVVLLKSFLFYLKFKIIYNYSLGEHGFHPSRFPSFIYSIIFFNICHLGCLSSLAHFRSSNHFQMHRLLSLSSSSLFILFS